MDQTYFGSNMRAGYGTLTDSVYGGFVVMEQTTTVTTAADGSATSATITIPAQSQILNFFLDGVVDAVVGGGSATTVPVTIGTAAAGTQYLSATNAIAGGRVSLSFTTAQVAAMANVGTNQSVVVTADPNGTIATTQGVYRLTVVYAQKV